MLIRIEAKVYPCNVSLCFSQVIYLLFALLQSICVVSKKFLSAVGSEKMLCLGWDRTVFSPKEV